MITRVSSASVFLNGRLISFPLGASARDVYAQLAKHSPAPVVAPLSAPRKAPVKRKTRETAPHPFQKLADAIAYRLENPKLRASQRDAAPRHGKGSNGRQKKVMGYTPADGAKTVSFNGYNVRPLSETDRAEIRGAITLALLSAPTDARNLSHALGIAFRGETGKEIPALVPRVSLPRFAASEEISQAIRLDFSAWKQCFSAARATLGMNRKTAREDLAESLEALQETDFHSGLLEDQSARAHREAALAEEAEAERALRARLTVSARPLHRACQAAFRAETLKGARRRVANFKCALAHLRRALRATLGTGHAHSLSRPAAYDQDRVFRAYLETGRAQLAREEAERAEAESTAPIYMDAVCNW